jgi:DNA-binding NarL/FixJ family response regulator
MSQHIYVVEDHSVMRDMLCEFLASDDDIEVLGSAADGQSALDDLEAMDPRPNLVLIDVSLPGMDGIDVLKKVQETYDDVLCLMLSGHAEESYVREADAAGARGYVIKGQPKAILEAVQAVLDGATYYSDAIEDHWIS